MDEGIREADVQTDAKGVITSVRLVFGPHHSVDLRRRDDGGVELRDLLRRSTPSDTER